MIFQVCLDESGYASRDLDDAFFLAGYIGSIPSWEAFTDLWINLENDSPRLTSKDFKHLLRTRRNDKRIEKFVSIIKECKLSPIAMQIPNREYWPVLADMKKLRQELYSRGIYDAITIKDVSRMENAYYLGFWGIAILLTDIMGRLKRSDSLRIIYDHNKTERKTLKEGYQDVCEIMPENAKWFHVEPSPETDDDFMPLQAADLLVWHMHRDYIGQQSGNPHRDTVWEMLRHSPAILEMVWTERMIRDALHLDEIRQNHLS